MGASSSESPASRQIELGTQSDDERCATEQFGGDAHVAAWHAWRRGESERFLKTLDPAAGSFTFQTFDDTKLRRTHLTRVLDATFGAVSSQLDSLNAEGAGVFVTVNKTNGRGRKNSDVQDVRALVLDLDGAPLNPILAAALAPHIVCESSPLRYHAYWLCTGCRKEEYGPLQRALAARFDGDPNVHDLARVMRLPGFWHQKSAPFISRLISVRDAAPFAVEELVQGLGLAHGAADRTGRDASHGPPGRRAGRNNYLSAEAYRLRKQGLSVEQIRQVMRAMNTACLEEPLDDREVTQIVRGKAAVSPDCFDAPSPSPELSEDALAVDFADRAQHAGFRWSPGLGWMSDAGSCWTRDVCLGRFQMAREVCRDAAAKSDKDAEKKRITSKNCIHAVVQLAQADSRILVPDAMWDRDPLMLNTPDGVVDLRTGIMRAKTGDDYFTKCTRVTPVAGPSPLFATFLDDIFAGDSHLINFAKRTMGYFLTGDRREQLVFFWHGIGANGKSVLADLLLWILGDYAVKLPATTLMMSRYERHPTELAQLKGKRLAISSELDEGAFFNEALLKELSGDCSVAARFMRGDFFNFEMTHKHLIVGNHRPKLRGGDPAVARRITLVPFRVQFAEQQRDRLMLQKLQAEARQILHGLIAEASAWSQDGLQIPAAVREASDEYMAENDDVAQWIAEHCDLSGQTRAAELYQDFSKWKQLRGETPPSMRIWGQRMNNVPGVVRRRSNVTVYTGVRLRL